MRIPFWNAVIDFKLFKMTFSTIIVSEQYLAIH